MAANKAIVLSNLNILVSSVNNTKQTLDQLEAINLKESELDRSQANRYAMYRQLLNDISQNRIQIEILSKQLITICNQEITAINKLTTDDVYISRDRYSQIQQLVAQISGALGQDITKIGQEINLKRQELEEIVNYSRKINDLKLGLKKGKGLKKLNEEYGKAINKDLGKGDLNIEHYKLMYEFYFSFKNVLAENTFVATIDLNKLLKVNFNDLQTDFYQLKSSAKGGGISDSNSVMKTLIQTVAKKATP